jgi:ribosomal protein S11
VSGVGDDANPCSRTAPCKTFAGAISKTANGGEINCLDPGGFGGVTIGKSLTIKCHYTEGGVLVSGTNAIVINATATDSVTLRGLDINGIGVGAQTSLSGVKVLSAARVNILDSQIYRFQSGVTIAPTSSQTRTVLKNNHIHDNGIGVINAPGNNTIQFTSAVLRYNDIQHNTCGVVVSSQGTNGSTPAAASSCGTAAAGAISKIATVGLYHNGINFNGFGVFTRGASATAEIAYNEVTNSDNFGLLRSDGSTVRTTVPPTNVISGNAMGDAPNASVNLLKRHPKRIR